MASTWFGSKLEEGRRLCGQQWSADAVSWCSAASAASALPDDDFRISFLAL